jgi:glutathione synthase/RimK-type ligase-like ATP-grasp enzyme
VPSEVRKLAYEIDAYFEEYPRFYGIDFMNTSKGWKLIEINSRQLGLVSTVWGPDSTYTLNKLADYLIELCTVDHPVSHASAFAAGV